MAYKAHIFDTHNNRYEWVKSFEFDVVDGLSMFVATPLEEEAMLFKDMDVFNRARDLINEYYFEYYFYPIEYHTNQDKLEVL